MPMFIAALYTIAKICKQPKCPSTDERIKKDVIYNYNGILAIKKAKFYTNVDGPREYAA